METTDPVPDHRPQSTTAELKAEDLVGAWLLEDLRLTLRHRTVRPRCQGTLLYTPSGHFSATIHVSSRRLPRLGKSLGYTGTYTVERGVVTHHTLVATWPFGAGSRQRRWATLTPGDGSADLLRLGGDPGGSVQFLLAWHRITRA
ncbi:lipocalin-like domain-containing protein [Amycolatopsis azurea]|uniref:lipocalin-like domain-containing protein n=1 Tax=Amycolatopsis azurea TaxID=36819 RepID=UPI00380DC2DA